MVECANATRFGLGAAVFSQDPARAYAIGQQLAVGVLAINQSVSSDFELPFGGVKASGFGRELGQAGLYEFANLKTILGPLH